MNKNTLRKFLNIDKNLKGMDLSLDILTDNKERIKKLFDIALEEEFTVYFDGRYVEEPYDGLEFKTIEEEFYYYNSNSYLVFKDNIGDQVCFKIKFLKEYDFEKVYKVVEKACNYTKAHPEVSEYKLY